MSNISKENLLDKDIRLLKTKTGRYIKSVGNPKELYIWINPKTALLIQQVQSGAI